MRINKHNLGTNCSRAIPDTFDSQIFFFVHSLFIDEWLIYNCSQLNNIHLTGWEEKRDIYLLKGNPSWKNRAEKWAIFSWGRKRDKIRWEENRWKQSPFEKYIYWGWSRDSSHSSQYNISPRNSDYPCFSDS